MKCRDESRSTPALVPQLQLGNVTGKELAQKRVDAANKSFDEALERKEKEIAS